jgi:prepilin-type processing-associated H-X9-DG protein
MMFWDGAVNVSNGKTIGTAQDSFCLDDWAINNTNQPSSAMSFPNPMNPPQGYTEGYYDVSFYSNPIALGEGLSQSNYNNCSGIPGSCPASVLTLMNGDWTSAGNYNTSSGNYGEYACAMRFRHGKNNVANFLFADGHVDSRTLGSVVAKDVCCNPY